MAGMENTTVTRCPDGWVSIQYKGTGTSSTTLYVTEDRYIEMDTTWRNWCATTYSNTMTNCTTAWYNWANEYVKMVQVSTHRQIKEATPEEAAAQIARIEAARVAQAARDKLQAEALQRSERLLLEVLDEQQTKDFRENKKFKVIGQDGQVYEINAKYTAGNIHRLDKQGKKVENFCVPMSGGLPRFDQIVAQVLALQCNLEHIVEKANRYLILPDGTRRSVATRQPIAVAG